MPSDKIDRLLFAAMVWAGLLALIATDEVKYGRRGPPRPEITAHDVNASFRPGTLSYANSVIGYFVPLPRALDSVSSQGTDEQAKLGRLLFFDPRLSKSQKISCNSCHPLSKFGADGRAVSVGDGGQKGRRNAPTVLNVAGHAMLFWDGRARNLEEQLRYPIFSPLEMAMPNEKELVERLSAVPAYRAAFVRAFRDAASGIRFEHVQRALSAFERRLITPSRWDRFVVGYSDAITVLEKEGFVRFVQFGCNSCHSGSLFGGGVFERLGIAEPWPNQTDTGRAEVTKQAGNRMVFKVPSLRNVAKTAPYFHDASAKTLSEAVRMMARYQTGRKLLDKQVRAITAWLNTLTGELPRPWTDAPELPPSAP